MKDSPLQSYKILDLSYHPDQWTPASKKRLFLAAYIDYLMIGIPWMFFQFVVRIWLPELNAISRYWLWIIFGLFELSVYRFKVPSPGFQFLSIKKFEYQGSDHNGQLKKGKIALVDSWIKSNEFWFSMIAAVIFLNTGAKSAVRWMMWNPPIPFFGIEIGDVASAGVYSIMGAAEIAVGYFLLKLRPKAFLIGLPYVTLNLISTIQSWNLWDPFVAELVVRRRAYQGLPVREGTVELFQAFVPEVIVFVGTATFCILLTLMLLFRRIHHP
jgi:hypothetical protein